MQAARSPRSAPPGPARAATARPSPPACPGRPSRLRGASAQRARRRQHAHGGPRARAALRPPRGSPRQAAAPLRAGAPHGRAAAPPLSPAQSRGQSRMGEGREAGRDWASRAPSRSARPRRLGFRAGSGKFSGHLAQPETLSLWIFVLIFNRAPSSDVAGRSPGHVPRANGRRAAHPRDPPAAAW